MPLRAGWYNVVSHNNNHEKERRLMSWMSPEDVVEMKHSLAGMAEILRSYFKQLMEEGFTDSQALAIVIGWQTSLLQQRPE